MKCRESESESEKNWLTLYSKSSFSSKIILFPDIKNIYPGNYNEKSINSSKNNYLDGVGIRVGNFQDLEQELESVNFLELVLESEILKTRSRSQNLYLSDSEALR